MPEVVAYGSDPAQFLELTLPQAAGPAPVAVVLHGGFWRAAYGVELARPLAAELAAARWAAVAVEYPRGGARGGGGPGPPRRAGPAPPPPPPPPRRPPPGGGGGGRPP